MRVWFGGEGKFDVLSFTDGDLLELLLEFEGLNLRLLDLLVGEDCVIFLFALLDLEVLLLSFLLLLFLEELKSYSLFLIPILFFTFPPLFFLNVSLIINPFKYNLFCFFLLDPFLLFQLLPFFLLQSH